MSRLEIASRKLIEARQLARLQLGIGRILPHNRFYHEKLFRDNLVVNIERIEDLATLPFTTKTELLMDQERHPPFGTNLTYPLSEYIHLHHSKQGQGRFLKALDTRESWNWWAECWTTAYRAVGVTRSDIILLVHEPDAISLWSAFEGAKRLGALTVPINCMAIHEALTLIQECRATVVVCSKEFAEQLRIVVLAAEQEQMIARVRMTIHADEGAVGGLPGARPRPPEWDAISYRHAHLLEVGIYGFSCSQQEGIHVNESEFIAEIVDPETLQAVQEGETGELILTNLGRWCLPALRYRTGLQVEHGGYHCRCGRSYLLLH